MTLIEELEQAAIYVDAAAVYLKDSRHWKESTAFAAALRARIARLREFEATFASDSRYERKAIFARLAGPLDPREEPGT